MNVEQLRKMAAEAGFELIMKHKDGSTTVLPDALFKNFAALVLAEHRSQGEVAAHGEADRLLDEYMAACARSDVEARDQARAAVRAAFARASVTPEGDAEAWMHEDDPARVISAIQKSQAEKDGGASASSVKAYSIRLNKHQSKAQGATAEDWVSAIAPLMPADFKDWHQNNPNEWPRVTAEVIRALRESEAFWIEQAGKPKAQPKGMPGVLRQRCTVYVLNERGVNRWSALVQPGQDDDGRRVSDDECEAVAEAIRAALATQAPAPAPVVAHAGWVIRDRSDLEPDAIDIEGPGHSRVVLTKDHQASRTLYALASALLATQAPAVAHEVSELVATAEQARDVLAELYAKYQTKIGPFASQAQLANVKLGAALKALSHVQVQPAGEQA